MGGRHQHNESIEKNSIEGNNCLTFEYQSSCFLRNALSKYLEITGEQESQQNEFVMADFFVLKEFKT